MPAMLKTECLGTFTKLQEAAISFFMSVHLSIPMEQLGSQLMDFHEVWYLTLRWLPT